MVDLGQCTRVWQIWLDNRVSVGVKWKTPVWIGTTYHFNCKWKYQDISTSTSGFSHRTHTESLSTVHKHRSTDEVANICIPESHLTWISNFSVDGKYSHTRMALIHISFLYTVDSKCIHTKITLVMNIYVLYTVESKYIHTRITLVINISFLYKQQIYTYQNNTCH